MTRLLIRVMCDEATDRRFENDTDDVDDGDGGAAEDTMGQMMNVGDARMRTNCGNCVGDDDLGAQLSLTRQLCDIVGMRWNRSSTSGRRCARPLSRQRGCSPSTRVTRITTISQKW